MPGLKIPFTGLKKQYSNLRTEILDATDEVLRSGQLMNGNNTAEFEDWLAKKNHSKYAITCHSGTNALEVIASYYAEHSSISGSPKVLVPSLTYPATINAFIRSGWEVTIVDTNKYGILDYTKVSDRGYDAVVLVGLYGADVARAVTPWPSIIIEDAAQHWLSRGCTRFGIASAISFDPMKNLPSYGNGGAVVTNDVGLYEYAQGWRDNGKPTHIDTGTNSRMSEVDCAQMLVKTKYLDQWQKRRLEIASYWISKLENTGIRSLIDDTNFTHHSFHKFVIETNNRDILKLNLELRNIETKIHYKEPLHELPAYAGLPGPNMLSCATTLSRRVLTLPLYPELTDLEVEYIVNQVLDCV